jgi:hypothetical protein
MAKTILRAGTRRSIRRSPSTTTATSKLVTKPGGLNPGWSTRGRLLVQPLPSGGNHGIGRDMQESERQVVKTAFLEDFFRILTDPGDRWTATQVLEMVAKQGVLIGPFADRYETEKVGVLVERVLDILMRAGQIAPMPPEMVEAGAYPLVYMKNPLARMARAARRRLHALGRDRRPGRRRRSAGSARPGQFRRRHGRRRRGARRAAELDAERRRARALRQQREQAKEAAAAADVMPAAAGAALDLAKANQIAQLCRAAALAERSVHRPRAAARAQRAAANGDPARPLLPRVFLRGGAIDRDAEIVLADLRDFLLRQRDDLFSRPLCRRAAAGPA